MGGKYHGYSRDNLYVRWCIMKGRCNNNKHYKNISVCNEWKNSFLVFREWAIKNGYRKELTLDRINNNDDYKPSNCRWITQEKQLSNTSRNRRFSYMGKFFTIREWSTFLAVPYEKLRKRFNLGWTMDRIIDNC